MPTLADGALLERVARGDADAFTVLYRRFERPVFGMLLRLAGAAEALAEEWLQEAFAPRVWLGAAGPHDPVARRGPALDLQDRPQHRAQRDGPQAVPDAPRLARRGRARRAGRAGERGRSRPAWTRRGGRPPSPRPWSGCPTSCARSIVLRCSRRAVVRRDRRGDGRPAGDAQVALPPRRRRAARGPRAGSGEGAMRHPAPGELLELHFGELRADAPRRGRRPRPRLRRLPRPPGRRGVGRARAGHGAGGRPARRRPRARPRPHRGGPAGSRAAGALASHFGAVRGGPWPAGWPSTRAGPSRFSPSWPWARS